MSDNFNVTVFCGSSIGSKEIYKKKTIELGEALVSHNASLVYGGGNRGLMGVLAHTVYSAGGIVTGVLPEAMNKASVTTGAVSTKTIIVKNMHERKKTMYEYADGFIALPGGIGTFEELCEIYTWRQLGYTDKNIALYNVDSYFDPFLALLDKAVQEGFVSKAVRDLLIVSDDSDFIIKELKERKVELPDKLS